MKAEISDFGFYVLLPLACAFVLVFLIHAFYVTPKRLYEAQQVKAENLKTKLETQENAPRFASAEAQMIYEVHGADAKIIGARLELRHTGKNSADDISCRIWTINQKLSDGSFANRPTDNVNEVGNGSPFAMTARYAPGTNVTDFPPVYFVCVMRYRDAVTKKHIYKQAWFFKWPQAHGGGQTIGLPGFGGISVPEKIAILNFLKTKRPELMQYFPDDL